MLGLALVLDDAALCAWEFGFALREVLVPLLAPFALPLAGPPLLELNLHRLNNSDRLSLMTKSPSTRSSTIRR